MHLKYDIYKRFILILIYLLLLYTIYIFKVYLYILKVVVSTTNSFLKQINYQIK